jgi:hypothetical protein
VSTEIKSKSVLRERVKVELQYLLDELKSGKISESFAEVKLKQILTGTKYEYLLKALVLNGEKINILKFGYNCYLAICGLQVTRTKFKSGKLIDNSIKSGQPNRI